MSLSQWLRAIFGAMFVFVGATLVLSIVLLPFAILPDIYGLPTLLIMIVIAISLALTAAIISYRTTVRSYTRSS